MTDNTPAKKEETSLASLPAEVASANWGVVEDIETTDILIPKIFHQQGLSKLVMDGKARIGDFCDSLTGEVLCKKEDKLSLIIFGVVKTMVIQKMDIYTNKFKLDRIITVTKENAATMAAKQLTEEVDGDKYQNNLCYNYYCLVPGNLRGLPYMFSLTSTKAKVARKLNALMLLLSQHKVNGAAVHFDFTSTIEKNDKGTWAGLDVERGAASTAEEVFAAHAWYQKSKSSSFVAADTDTDEDVNATEGTHF